MLRGDRPEDTALAEYARTLSVAIQKNELRHDVICYRNVDLDLYSDLTDGDIFKEKQFISTSVVKKAALDKKYKVTIYAPKGSKCAYNRKT